MCTPEASSSCLRAAAASRRAACALRALPCSLAGLFLLLPIALMAAGEDDWLDWSDDPAGAAAATPLQPRPHLPLDPADGAPLPELGEVLDAGAEAALPVTIYPDGRGLPPGEGTVAEGAALHAGLCARCHGPDGRGGSAPELAGGRAALDGEYPDQNIGTYWPHATTVFDFLRRAMPMFAPGSLDDDQYYALTAFLLERNGLWPADRPLDGAGLASVRMPNREGFDSYWPDHGVHP